LQVSVKNKKTSDTSYKTILSHKEAIEKELANFFKQDAKTLLYADISPFGKDSISLLKEFNLRPAKRLRGSLACLAYDYTTSKSQGSVGLKAAAAIELVQDYLLIIDDVMDLSATRRGGPTIHELYKTEGFDDHTAKMLAINVGLLAQHFASLIIANIDADPGLVVQALKILHRNIGLTCMGQLDDLNQNVNREVEQSAVLMMYKLKSSYYTFVDPLQIGVVLGGQTDTSVLNEIEDFGINAGIAFQLRDDVLGLFGDPLTTGKPITDDIKEGKHTLLINYGFKHLNTVDKKYLKSKLGCGNVSNQEIEKVQAIIRDCGAEKYVEDQIVKYANKARAIVDSSNFWDNTTKDLLSSLVTFSEGRKK